MKSLSRAVPTLTRSLAVALVTMGAVNCQRVTEERMMLDVEFTQEASVGLLDGPEELLFGNIREVRAAPDGSFFVLDSQARAVRWYNSEMAHMGGITARGAGPGELGMPLAIAVTPEGRLGVLDPPNGRITTYQVTPQGLQYEDAASPVVLSPYGGNERNLCGAGDRWYVYQLDEDQVIREYEVSGDKVRSFQPAVRLSVEDFGSMTPIAEPVVNSGMLVCLADRSLVISAGLRSNVVRAHSVIDGSLVWEVSLSGIFPEQYVLNPAPGFGGGFPMESEGTHVGVSLVRWSDDTLIVQYRFWAGNRQEPDITRIESVQLSIESGQELARSDRLPVVADVWQDLVFTVENNPYPRVLVLRRRVGG